MSASAAVVAAAIHEVEHGFAAFALRANAKVPVTEHGFLDATTNPEWVATQLAAPIAGNYGIVWPATCERRIVVFDLDNGSDGRERPWQDRLRELIERIGPLPVTKATRTPSDGRHAFYGWPAGVPIPSGDELFGFTVRWPGRGYLVGPGSSIDGRPYLAGETDVIVELPAAWVDAALAERPVARPREAGGSITISGSFELPERIPSGRRYATVRDYVASRYNSGLSDEELWELVRAQVAPRFDIPKTDAELRADFGRVMAKIAERLGPPARAPRLSPRDAIAAMSPIRVTNMADIAVEAVVWLWHRYLPVGAVTLFDGNPGEGKSTIVADIVARVSRGSVWPDETPIGAPGDVLYVTKEDDASTQVRPRIEAAGGDVRRVLFVGGDLLFPRDTGRFREVLDGARPRLVVLDPLMSYLEGGVRTISDNDIRSAIMTPLSEMVREAGTAMIVVRHFSKQSGQAALMRGAGSLGGLAGAARMVIALTPDPEDEDGQARVFGVVKSNYEARPPSLRATIESAPVPGFLMTVSRVAWHGESATSVGDLMERTRDEHQLVLEAEDSLREILATSPDPVPGTTVLASMKSRGHGKSAIYAAARTLHVHVARVGYPAKTTWALPDVSQSSQSSANDDDQYDYGTSRSRTGRPQDVTTNTTTESPPARAGAGETPDDWTTNTTNTTEEIPSPARNRYPYQMTEMSNTTDQSVVPVVLVVQSSGGTPRPPAPAREAGDWLRPCRDYVRHQSLHHQSAEGWACATCDEETR